MQVPLEVNFVGLPVTEALERSCRREALKLERYVPRIIGCRVVVAAPSRRRAQGNLHEVRIQIRMKRQTVAITRFPSVRARNESLSVALRDAFDKARRQLQDKIRVRRGAVKLHEAAARRTPSRPRGRPRSGD
jgi:ribosome-associated translation inhibitor RaiA